MPNVGGKKFAYTPEGEAAAAEYAQQTGAPFQMRAKGFNNSPMQKNFTESIKVNETGDLALNKKLDKNDTEGGLTGGPNMGKLDGPLQKKGNFLKNLGDNLKRNRRDIGGEYAGMKQKDKPKTETPNTGIKTYGYDSGYKTPSAPKSKPYVKPKSKTQTKADVSAKKSTGVLRSSGNKKAPATKTPHGGFNTKTGKFNFSWNKK